jgi:DNA-binding NarL/FixJ family response regulator
MLKIAYIGKLNQTNGIISEAINTSYGADITFYEPTDVFSQPSTLTDELLDLVIVDLNTSLGLGNAPDNIQRLNQQIPTSPLLVLHPYENNKLIEPLVEAGANSIIPITPTEEELFQAINKALNNDSFIIYPE